MTWHSKFHVSFKNKAAGGYMHSMIATFESEITGSFYFYISLTWDRISKPAIDSDGVKPEPDDYRLTVGANFTC